jgi:hypothetical protein
VLNTENADDPLNRVLLVLLVPKLKVADSTLNVTRVADSSNKPSGPSNAAKSSPEYLENPRIGAKAAIGRTSDT